MLGGARTEERPQEDTEKVAVCEPRREASGESSAADTWILRFQPPDHEEVRFSGLSHAARGALLRSPNGLMRSPNWEQPKCPPGVEWMEWVDE